MLIERSHIKQKMNFRDRLSSIKAAFTGLPNQSLLTLAQRFAPIYGEPPRRSTKDWIELYNNSPRMNPIHQIASDVAISTFGLYDQNSIKKTKMKNNPVEKLLKKPNPNLTITQYVLFYLTQVYLMLPSGECFWLKERNGLGRVTELWPVPPSWVLFIPSVSSPYFSIYPQGNMQAQPIYVLPEDVVYFKKPDVANPYLRGVGRAQGISDEIETDEYMAKHVKRYFWNDAIPSMIMQMPGADEATINRQEEQWAQKFGGYNNKHKTAFVNWELKAQVLKETAKDMDFIESRKYLRDTSNQHFNVPPELFGIIENSNKSTINAAMFLYTKNVLRKELKFIDDTLNLQLVPEFGNDIYLEHDNVVAEDEDFVLKRASEGLKNGGILVDEWRLANGFEPLPNGKGQILYTPLNMIPTTLDGEALQTNIPPAPAPEPPPPEPTKQLKKKALTPEMKNQMWHVIDKAAVKNERLFISALKKYFQAQQDKINRSLEKSIKAATDDPDELLAWQAEDAALLALMTPLWMQSLGEGATTANELFGFGISFDVLNPRFLDWIKANGLDRAKGINDTTKEKLRTTLSEGIEGGEGIPKLRDRVSQVYSDAKGYRATLISRTETITTVNTGSLFTMKAGGIMRKEWLSTLDSRVRPEHAGMNGQIVGIDEPFSNGEMVPSSPNCRCTILSVLPE